MLKKIVVLLEDMSWNIPTEISEKYRVKFQMEDADSGDTLVISNVYEMAFFWKQQGYSVLYISKEAEFAHGISYISEDIQDCNEEYLNMIFSREKGIPMKILETERTYVREISVLDLPELYQIYDDQMIREHVEPLYDLATETEYVKGYIKNMYGLYGYGLWLVFDKKNNCMIGRAGISLREIDGIDRPELGYIIRKEYREKGYGYEVCKEIIKWMKDKISINELIILTEKTNFPSCKLAEKLGFLKSEIQISNEPRYVLFQYRD